MYDIQSMNADSFYGFFHNTKSFDKVWIVATTPKAGAHLPAIVDVRHVRNVALGQDYKDGPARYTVAYSFPNGTGLMRMNSDAKIFFVISDTPVTGDDFKIGPDGTTPINKAQRVMLEAQCAKCGETFNPNDEDDTIHGVTEDGNECGGQGWITGGWVQG